MDGWGYSVELLLGRDYWLLSLDTRLGWTVNSRCLEALVSALTLGSQCYTSSHCSYSVWILGAANQCMNIRIYYSVKLELLSMHERSFRAFPNIGSFVKPQSK